MGAVVSKTLSDILSKFKLHIRSKWKSKCCKNSFCGCFMDIGVIDEKNSPPNI